jgi:LysR family transcriptional regulator, hydrogen peroxide-inducible genes activator
MELHQLRYFTAVARTGNFSRAAEQCHVSQPSLSQQIQKLEDELGERLFHRLRRKAKLTPAGQVLLPRAARILEEVESARREARDAQELKRGRVVLGVLPTIAPYLLPRVLAGFVRQWPGIDVVVQEDTTARLLELAAHCELDFAIASLPIPEGAFEVMELFSEELLLALPPDHPLTRKQNVSLDDFEGERFILMKEGHCLGDQILSFCNKHDFQPNVSCRSAQVETVKALVRAGLGISLVPKMAVDEKGGREPLFLSLRAPRPQRTIVVLWPRARPLGRAARAVVKNLQETAQG